MVKWTQKLFPTISFLSSSLNFQFEYDESTNIKSKIYLTQRVGKYNIASDALLIQLREVKEVMRSTKKTLYRAVMWKKKIPRLQLINLHFSSHRNANQVSPLLITLSSWPRFARSASPSLASSSPRVTKASCLLEFRNKKINHLKKISSYYQI